MPENILILEEREFEEFRKFCREKGFDLSYISVEEVEIPKFLSKEKIKKKLEKQALERNSRVVKLQSQKATFYDVAEYEKERWDNAFQEIYEEFKKIHDSPVVEK